MANLQSFRDIFHQLDEYRWILQTNSIQRKEEVVGGRRVVYIRLCFQAAADAMDLELPWQAVEDIALAVHSIGLQLLRLPAVRTAVNDEELRVVSFLAQEITSVDQEQIDLLWEWLLRFPPLPIGPASLLFGAYNGIPPR